MKRLLITSPATQHGFTIGDLVEFTERVNGTPTLAGTGIVVGFSNRDSNVVAVEKRTIAYTRNSIGWSGFFSNEPRKVRPFAVTELERVMPAAKLSGKPGTVLLVEDIAPRKPHEFKKGDLIKRIVETTAPHMYGQVGETYTVKAVSGGGHPLLNETGFYASMSSFTLVKTAEQIAAESLLNAPPMALVPVPAPKVRAFRVLSADGKTASSRTWSSYEEALKDATARAERDENFREFQVVGVLTKAKAEKIAVTQYKRGPVLVDKVA